jgi:uncharacterized protein (TIGR03067 family)
MYRLIPALCLLLVVSEDAGKKDLDAMQGDWAGERLVRDGQTLEDDDAQALFRTVKGNAYTVQRFRKKAGAGTFTLDATKTPKQIDIVPDGAAAGVVIRGIYTVEGDRLTMCYAAPKQERPKAFESKEGSAHTLMVWVREKKK